MFSKALFKQSCKANGLMWGIITFAVCFMLACVMLIAGSGNIAGLKNGIQDTIMESSIDSELKNRSINYYLTSSDALTHFDTFFKQTYAESATFAAKYGAYLQGTITEEPQVDTSKTGEVIYKSAINTWLAAKPVRENFADDETFNNATTAWQAQMPKPSDEALTAKYYMAAVQKLEAYMLEVAESRGYEADSVEAQELKGLAFYILNPNGQFDSFYTDNENFTETPPRYDMTTINEEGRAKYISDYAMKNSSIFLAGNMISQENIDKILTQMARFKVSQEDYEALSYEVTEGETTKKVSRYTGSYGYKYMKDLSNNALVSFIARLDDKMSDDSIATLPEEEKALKRNQFITEIAGDITGSILTTMPQDVSKALTELGEMDIYSLIVGSIFYKMAGLLLPIIYMIMVANNLIAGQVDSGSMAYVLSTSTKRKQVVFTQAIFLVSSLFAMFVMTTITSVVCLSILDVPSITLTYSQLILLNLGAFLTMFAMSGLSFMASCIFNRSKRSMAIGGGLNMFFLVATMLGLFGSQVLPSVIRLNALNYFNFVSVISLFDVVSILGGTTTFIWKLAILVTIGVVLYFIGARRFEKKDLPL